MLVEKPGGEDGLSRAYLYARHASKAFNRRMHKILQDLCRELAGELSGNLYAVLLGGNYGRGEGGTRSSTGGHGTGIWSIGEAPAEDIDLLIVSWFDIRGRREAISGIIRKYEDIFTVPIDLAPVVTPVRLMFIPHRFNWRRLISNSKLLYGPPVLPILFLADMETVLPGIGGWPGACCLIRDCDLSRLSPMNRAYCVGEGGVASPRIKGNYFGRSLWR
jgi:hypothetical protein